MRQEASKHAPRAESGGLILGYWASPTDCVVTHLTTPGPKAIRASARFVPDPEHDEQLVERLWRATDGASTYLGDWHSHPVSDGSLSGKDRRTLGRIAGDPEAFAPNPIMAVLARPAKRWLLEAWLGRRTGFGWFHWLRCERVELLMF